MKINSVLIFLILGVIIFTFGCINAQEKSISDSIHSQKTIDIVPKVETPNQAQSESCVESNGIVTYGNNSFQNRCLDKKTLEIVFCNKNNISMQNISCESGYECSSASCSPLPKNCMDSDEGKTINVTGTVTYLGVKYTDYCEVGNLHEYYCINDELTGGIVSCPPASECKGGKCIYLPPTCTENEGYIKFDPRSSPAITFKDYCNGTEYLVHYYCEGNQNKSEIIHAKDNELCDKSLTNITLKFCNDSDGGIITEVAGIVRYGIDEYPDKCVGNNTAVREYFCDNNSVESVIMECKFGCAENVIGEGFGTFVGYCR